MNAFNARRNEAIAYDILTPETPHSGVRRPRTTARDSIVDAEFITIREPAGTSRHGNDNNTRSTPTSNPLSPLATMAERVETWLSRLSADRFSALVAALFVTVFVLCGGLSSFFTGSAPAAPTRPIVITHASLTAQDANGMRLLAINGIVENHGASTMSIPPIRAELISGETRIASVVIDPPVASIQAGHSHGFATRIAHPGGKMPELKLSFGGEDVP